MRILLLALLSIAALGQAADSWDKAIKAATEAAGRGEFVKARGFLLADLRRADRTPPMDDPARVRTAIPLIALGYLDVGLRRLADATQELQRAVQILNECDPTTEAAAEQKALALAGLTGAVLRRQGPAAGLTVAQDSLTFARQRFGPEHWLTGLATNQMGSVYHRLGEYSHAAALFAVALDLFEKSPDRSPDDIGRILVNLCSAQARLGLYEIADVNCARAISYLRQGQLGTSPAMSQLLEVRASVLYHLGRKKEAKDLRQEAASLRRRCPAQEAQAFVDLPYRR